MKRGKKIVVIIAIIAALLVVFFLSKDSDNTDETVNNEIQSCAQAGELALNIANGKTKQCCSGLDEIKKLKDGNTVQCLEYSYIEEIDRICTDCGNNICEEWENKCICPVDCK